MAYKKNSTYKPGLKMPPYINFQNPDVKAKDLNKQKNNSQETVSAEGGVIPLIYGKGRVGSKIFALTQYRGDLVLGALFCEGPVHSIESVDINDTTATSGTTIESFLGTYTQTRSGILATAFGTATYTDTLRYAIPGGTESASSCYSAVRIKPGEISGFPRIAAIIKGKKVYDPRDATQTASNQSTYVWSDNPALCLADLITSKVYGLGATIDWNSVALTANFNDQFIGSPQEKSRTLNIVIDQPQEVKQWVEILRAYASCFVLEENGIYQLIPDKPIGYAANFTGASTSYGVVTYAAAQSVAAEMSFELSLKADAALASSSSCIFNRGGFNTEQIAMYYDKANNTATVKIGIAGPLYRTFTFPLTLATSTYKTISFSYRGVSAVGGTTAATAAVDGVSVTVTGTDFGSILSNTGNIQLGYVTSSNPFKGQIDEFRMWNRYRTLAEITANYNKAIVTKADPSLVIHIPFNTGFDSLTKASGASSWTVAATASDLTGNSGCTLFPTPVYGTASSAWSQYDNPADFFRFDQNNILADSTKFKRRGVANQPTIVEIAYTDQTSKPWREDFARIDQSQDAYNNGKRRSSKVSMPGITRYSQAYREAIERYNNIVSDSTVMFGAWDDAFVLQVSDGIQLHHPTIELWNEGTQTYSEIFKPYRITSIREKDYGKFDIVATEYDPQNYSTTAAAAPTYPDTNLPNIKNPPVPSSVTASEVLYKNKEGVWQSRITATVTPSTSTIFPYTKGFLFKLYKNSFGNVIQEEYFALANPTDKSSGTVTYLSAPLNAFNSTDSVSASTTAAYQLSVHTVSTIDERSAALSTDITVLGKYLKPSNVTNFQGFELNNKVILSWDAAVDIDIWRYDIRYYAAAGATDDATIRTAYNDTAGSTYTAALIDSLGFVLEGIQAGTWRFMISAVDSVGNYSLTPAFVDVIVTLDLDGYGLVTKRFTDWSGLGISQWYTRDSITPYFSTDWADPWRANETTTSNQTATFAVTTGALENTHSAALTFDGTTTGPYISIPYAAGHSISTTFTIEAYIYVNGSVAGRMPIFSTRPGNAAGCWTFEVGKGSGGSTDTGRLVMAGLGTTVVAQSNNGTILENTWHHVMAKVNSNTVSLYVDNVEVSYTTSTAYTFANNTNAKYIGLQEAANNNVFNGNIKRVKLYNVALSDADRLKSAEYYNNEIYSITGLVGAWMMLEGTGTAISDGAAISAGTISNTPLWTTTSYILTEAWDYGAIISGNWYATVNTTDHTGTSSKAILTSVDGTTWATNPGSSVNAEARYLKLMVYTTGNMTVRDWPSLSIVLEPKSETTPIIRTTASGGKLVLLVNEYATAKSILASPVALQVDVTTSSALSSIAAVIDRLLLAPVTGLMFTGQTTSGVAKTMACLISTASYAVTDGSTYLDYSSWLPANSPELTLPFKVVVNYSSGGATTSTPTLSAGSWVNTRTALVNTSTVSAVSIVAVATTTGIHTIVLKEALITNNTGPPYTKLATVWDYTTQGDETSRADPVPNTLSGDMINKKCGPTNSLLLYAFSTPLGASPVPVQIATDVSIKFEGA